MRKKVLKTLIAVAATVGMLATGMVAFAAENYTVEKDDYLKKIAKQTYGDEEKWEIIYEANKEQIKNPDEQWAPYLRSAVVFGRCRFMENTPETMEILKALAMKYFPPEDIADKEIAASGKAVQMYEIVIEHISGKEVQEK